MDSFVTPNAWAALKLPSELTKIIRICPNTTISLGKYGSFPANLILERPYHFTYELQDKLPGENFSRLRVVSPSELYTDVLAEEDWPSSAAPADNCDRIISATDGVKYSLVDADNGNAAARTDPDIIDATARQSLSQDEIEELKREGASAGKDIIAKLLLSHTALDRKTSFSLAKYKLLKTRKYIRRFQVLPLDVPRFARWHLEEKDASKVLDMREEMVALVGCWANVHYGGEDLFLEDTNASCESGEEGCQGVSKDLLSGRWLVVDDTCGFLVAAMAERMGILYPQDGGENQGVAEQDKQRQQPSVAKGSNNDDAAQRPRDGEDDKLKCDGLQAVAESIAVLPEPPSPKTDQQRHSRNSHRVSDLHIPYSQRNTITLVQPQSQPNLSCLNYFGFDITDPNPPPHPLAQHLLTLTWLQLLTPALDTTYSTPPPTATGAELTAWKAGRRGNFHRKRRRFARIRHAVDAARHGDFDGFVCASTMDPIGVLRHALPLLAGGAAVAIYSATLEPLTVLADCFSIARKAAWTSNPPVGYSTAGLDRWPGNVDFPINPNLLLGVSIQTSRVRAWQVLPGRTHPIMTGRGGSEGYMFTGWRVRPAEGRVEARGNFTNKKRKVEAFSAPDSKAGGTSA